MSDIVQKLWGFCHTLRHDGVDYGDYIEQLTYLLFLKMADEQEVEVPKNYGWASLKDLSGTELTDHYAEVLRKLREAGGRFGDFLEGQTTDGIVLAGLLTADAQSGQFLYAPFYNGFIAAYGIDGAERFVAATLDHPKPPQVTKPSEDEVRFHKLTSEALLSMSVADNNVFCLVRKGVNYFIDVYDGHSGAYQYSFNPPEQPTQAVMVGPTATYTAVRGHILVWERPS